MTETSDATETPPTDGSKAAESPVATKTAPPAAAPSDAVQTAPCYACGSTQGVPAGYRWWGPGALMSEVRCLDCGVFFNSKHGQSNGPWILFWHMFAFLMAASGVATWLLLR